MATAIYGLSNSQQWMFSLAFGRESFPNGCSGYPQYSNEGETAEEWLSRNGIAFDVVGRGCPAVERRLQLVGFAYFTHRMLADLKEKAAARGKGIVWDRNAADDLKYRAQWREWHKRSRTSKWGFGY